MAICTKSQQIYTVLGHTLSFWASSMVLDGWAGGGAGLRIAYSNQKVEVIGDDHLSSFELTIEMVLAREKSKS